MVKNIIIWDLEQKCKIKKGDVHFWASYNKTLNDISIPLLLEKESDNYRNLFLTFIYELSQSKINNKTFGGIVNKRNKMIILIIRSVICSFQLVFN